MRIQRDLLNDAARDGLISNEQAEHLWEYLNRRAGETPGFRATHILYYLGGLIAIGAMTLFMTLGWERFGGWGLFTVALLYGVVGLALTDHLLKRPGFAIPAGIVATFVVVLTPLAVYGLQSALGWWHGEYAYRAYHQLIDWRWLMMEFATLAVGVVLLFRYRLPFMVMPVAVTLWYMSMDAASFIAGESYSSWELRKIISIWFGLGIVALALYVDLRTRRDKDFAFWLYLFGVVTFWGGLSMLDSGGELNKFLYCCINLAMIAIGAILSRRVFAVFGGLGVAGYLGYLAYSVFQESLLFPFALTFIGFGLIGVGIVWQRREDRISCALRSVLPQPVRELLESRRQT